MFLKTQILNTNLYPRKKSKNILKKYMPFYILFTPVLLYYILFAYIPMIGVLLAFKDFNFLDGVLGSPWVGLAHFSRFLSNGDFWKVLKNTVIISSLRISFGFPAPIIFALLLNEIKNQKFKKITQTISYLPHFISWVVINGILFSFFSADGLVNRILVILGGTPYGFLSSDTYFRQFLVATSIWKELGWGAIIYLAALAGIDPELYEASVMDGANRFQRLINITLPGISIVISIMFVLSFANVLNAGFDQVLVMINPTVANVAEIIDYYIYRTGLMQVNNYSYATAVGLFKSIISLVLVLITNWGARKINEEGAIW